MPNWVVPQMRRPVGVMVEFGLESALNPYRRSAGSVPPYGGRGFFPELLT